MNSFTQHTATPSTYPAPYKSTGWPHPHHLNYTLMPNLYHNKMSPSRAHNIEWLQRDHPPLGYPQQPRNMPQSQLQYHQPYQKRPLIGTHNLQILHPARYQHLDNIVSIPIGFSSSLQQKLMRSHPGSSRTVSIPIGFSSSLQLLEEVE